MIWILVIATAAISALFLFGPLFRGAEQPNKLGLLGMAGAMTIAISGLYAWKGKPELTGAHADSLNAQYYYSQGMLRQSVIAYEDLIELYPDDEALQTEFENILIDLRQVSPQQLEIIQTVGDLKHTLNSTNSVDAKKWRLLANSQMRLGDYEGSLASFEKLVSIAPDNEAYRDEYEQAKNFIEAQTEAAQMSPEDRQAMIENMVNGLAARLYENGGTAEEWARLIRSRRNLGQEALLVKDIERVKKQFESTPEVLTQILGSER